MARIACLMMQKDEVLLLKPWLLHHGYLFGYENLFVYDNGSTLSEVRETLAQFKTLGVNIDDRHATPQDFADKGNIVTAKINEFRERDIYDVALPLDCDEFVAVTVPGGYSCGRNAVLAELRRIEWETRICRTSHGLYSLPRRLDLFQPAWHQKCIVAVPVFAGIDHGFHQARLADGVDYAPTSLTYLHLHYRPYAAFMAGATDKLRPWTNPDDLAALRNYEGTGKHLVRYFYMTEDEYNQQDLGAEPRLQFNGLRDFLAAHMDVAGLLSAWSGRAVAAPRWPVAASPSQPFDQLRAAGLKAMETGDYNAAQAIWSECRAQHPAEEEGYLYGAVAARAAGDEALLRHIHDEQERRFPSVFS